MTDNALKGLVSDENWDAHEASVKGNPYFHLDTLNERCRGYLVKKSLKKDDMKSATRGEDVWQRVYTILVPEGESYKAWSDEKSIDIKGGELMDVYGRMPVEMDGKTVNIIAGMEDAELGQLIGFKYVEQRKPTEKGHQGAKIVNGYKFPERRDDLVNKAMSAAATPADGDKKVPF